MDNIFNSRTYNIKKNVELHLIDVKSIEGELLKYIDGAIVSICEGNQDSSILEIKTQLIQFFDNKKDSEIELGAIAEFFIHLYLNYKNFKQDCLYLNLEELSIKKGFDGYYSKEKEEWILESKSGRISTKEISHPKKISEAYNDLKGKLAGKSSSKNDPWKNAFNHASLIHVESAEDVRKNLKKFSREFQKKQFHEIEDFNVIPSSTIFFDGNWVNYDDEEIKKHVSKWAEKLNGKGILAIGLSKKAKEAFLNYLKSNHNAN